MSFSQPGGIMESFPHQIQRPAPEELQARQRFLMEYPPFRFLPQTENQFIAATLGVENYQSGHVLFIQEETPINAVLIIKSGTLERSVTHDGQHAVKEVIERGRGYGGISLLYNNGISTSTLTCKTDVSVYTLDLDNFFRLCIKHSAFARFFSSKYYKASRQFSSEAEIPDIGVYDMQSSFFPKTVRDIALSFPSCTESTSIREAARLLTSSRRSAILVTNENMLASGIVTDYDLRNKVIMEGRAYDRPVGEIMTSPLLTIDGDAQVFDAIFSMMRNRVKHLAVQSNGTIDKVVTERDLFLTHTRSPVFLLKEMSSADDLGELKACHEKLPDLITTLIESNARSIHLNMIITALTDEMLHRVINMALLQVGPPPVEFAFLLFGSEGRKEQTLKTDQDNAIVFEDAVQNDEKAVRKYFLELGTTVCDWLNEIGQTHCKFDIMAKNPEWCQPLSRWKEYHRKWIESDDADHLLKASIFFDFRLGYGQGNLVKALHNSLFQKLVEWPGFFRHMARNTSQYNPPLSFFGNFVLEEKNGRKGLLDIKMAMQLVVDFARIYALQDGNEETNTTKRLEQAFQENRIDRELRDNLIHAYEYLMHHRIKHQAEMIKKSTDPPDNYLQPEKLTQIEQQALKEAFKSIRSSLAKLRLDFFLHF